MTHAAGLPKVKVKGAGAVVYHCATCHQPIEDEPVFHPPLPLKPETKTYHQEHLPDGR